jgi:hypothetical protein
MLLQLYKRFGAHTRNWQEAMEERQKNKKKHACHLPNPVLKRNLHMLKHCDEANKTLPRNPTGARQPHKFGIIFGTETCQDVQSPRKR